MPTGAKVYSIAAIVASALVSLVFWQEYPIPDPGSVIILGALALLADHFAFSLPVTGSVSLAFAMSHAGLLYGGPMAAIVVSVLGSVSLHDIRAEKPLLQMLFNSAQLILSATAAGLAYVSVGGVPFAEGMQPGGLASSVLPALLAAFAFFGVNIVLVGTWVAIRNRMAVGEVFRQQHFGVYWVSLLVLALLGFILANLLLASGWVGVLLLLAPFIIARQTFLAYRELEDAYAGTVRSLVAAMEAKDPYTSGHSERVAEYARMVAQRMGLGAQFIQRIEYAALLHDIGKIGMRTATLTKPGPLTREEYREIQSHTTIGRDLVSGVESLSDIQDAIYLHHERIDGTGYPVGLSGDAIPLEAKILAVADCFDAMTSSRPYRDPLALDTARSEILACAGRQLDADVVSVFLGLGDVLIRRAGELV
jgi:hypothetical protein